MEPLLGDATKLAVIFPVELEVAVDRPLKDGPPKGCFPVTSPCCTVVGLYTFDCPAVQQFDCALELALDPVGCCWFCC